MTLRKSTVGDAILRVHRSFYLQLPKAMRLTVVSLQKSATVKSFPLEVTSCRFPVLAIITKETKIPNEFPFDMTLQLTSVHFRYVPTYRLFRYTVFLVSCLQGKHNFRPMIGLLRVTSYLFRIFKITNNKRISGSFRKWSTLKFKDAFISRLFHRTEGSKKIASFC